MTPAQRRALEAVRDGRVYWSPGWRRYPGAHKSRRDVLDRLIDFGWVYLGHDSRGLFSARLVLTDAGREALDQ